MWLLAVAAGVVETVIHVADAPMHTLVTQIAVRTLVYGALFVVIDRFFRHGVPWSRYLLAGLLGTVGLASLLIAPVQWLLDPTPIDWSPGFLAQAATRTLHISAVLAALFLTFQRDTNRWFHH
jgi:hypothetical protein